MNVYEFEQLNRSEQIEMLYEHGVYIGKRMVAGYRAVLYQLDSFYVELVYKKYRSDISRISCSEFTSKLDPYLEQIDIEMLV